MVAMLSAKPLAHSVCRAVMARTYSSCSSARYSPTAPKIPTIDRPGRTAAIQATGYELEQRRYRAESALNQGIGYLYEVRVKVDTAESDRHRKRSTNFFYAMLLAQVGAVLSSLAMARKQKSTLWLMAAFVGVIAVGVGAYVYLTM